MIRGEIIYQFVIPTFEAREVTPFQGFAPGLLTMARMMELVAMLPTDILELTMEPADRLARRRAGAAGLMWGPISVRALLRSGHPPPEVPFQVVMSADLDIANEISKWRRNLRIPPLHVSSYDVADAIHPNELSIERLRQHCKTSLRRAKRARPRLDITDEVHELENWRPLERQPSSLLLHSHNVTRPNEMALVAARETYPTDEAGVLNVSPNDSYVTAITESVAAVLALNVTAERRPIFLLYPPRPDVILFAPAMYVGAIRTLAKTENSPAAKRALRGLERQRGYTMTLPFEEGDLEKAGPLLALRGAELKLETSALGLRAASTLAATIRFPPLVNRTAGIVGHLSRYLRSHDRPPDVKTARVFRLVQEALRDSLPAQHRELISQAKTGIKIVGDAPLEWFPVGDLPLGIRFDVSRIDATPGNLLIGQLETRPPVHIEPSSFKQYLVTSMFEAGDQIAPHIRTALRFLPGASETGITGTVTTPKDVDDFVDAVNAYHGPILIVDGHGEHPNRPNVGGLVIGGKPVDIWHLAGRVRLPPIVVLSACDTHPFDRSHATIANGFLRCGALAVLATALPIRSVDAAGFLVRLMLRAIDFGEAMNRRGVSVSWTNIVGGALRMQLASDVVHGLVKRGLLPDALLRDIQLQANIDINPPNERADWLERLRDRCIESGHCSTADWQEAYQAILGSSDAIRYLSVGNPEYILLSGPNVTRRVLAEAGEAMAALT